MAGEETRVRLSVNRQPYSVNKRYRLPSPSQDVDFTADAHAAYVGYHPDPRVLVTWSTKGDRRQAFEIILTRKDLVDMLRMIEEKADAEHNPLLSVERRGL